MANLSRGRLFAVLLAASFVLTTAPAHAVVKSFQKISDTAGNFTANLQDDDRFGIGTASLGDLDGDGVGDIATGAYFDDHEGTNSGAVYALLLNADGTVKSYVKIGNGLGGFTGDLDFADEFGVTVSRIGDLDDDGVVDIAVGARGDDDTPAGPDTGTNRGAVWILFLNSNSTVKSHQKISQYSGGFTGVLQDNDQFGNRCATIGDIDGDNVEDLAVSAYMTDDGGADRGAVWLLYLNPNGTVKSHQKISATSGGFTGVLDNGDLFGAGVTSLGDLDGDGNVDMAIGATGDDDGGTDRGGVWILFLNSDGTVESHQKISSTQGGFTGILDSGDGFGTTASLGVGCGGLNMLAVGAQQDDDGGTNRGAVWLLGLNSDGTVSSHSKISSTAGGFTGALSSGDAFGGGIVSLGDFDGDGAIDLAAGARLDDDGGFDRGAVWLLFLSPNPPCSIEPQTVSFGTVTLPQTADATFTISNPGCDPISGDVSESCDEFSIVSGGGPFTIPAGGSLTVTARFAPTTTGTFVCTVDVGNGGCGPVTLSGVAQNPPPSPNPLITLIEDVGNDQGRVVRIRFNRSGRDVLGSPTPILQYEIYRRIDELPSVVIDADARESVAEAVSQQGPLLEDWDYVGAIPAHGDLVYNTLAPTLADFSQQNGIHWSVFFVRAATAQPLTYFDSPPDSGYSIDNKKPGPPASFSIVFQNGLGNTLSWTAPDDPDVVQYYVYRDTDPEFEPSPENLLTATPETELVDPAVNQWQYYYLVTALDLAGNESDAAGTSVPTAIGDGTPVRSALHQNVPNPFNPSTTIAYDIAAPGGRVTLEIFDVRGQRIRTLVDQDEAPGSKRKTWDGRDNQGRRVASGVYFYRLKAGREVFTRKMAVVQ